jgi:hypothetical protein
MTGPDRRGKFHARHQQGVVHKEGTAKYDRGSSLTGLPAGGVNSRGGSPPERRVKLTILQATRCLSQIGLLRDMSAYEGFLIGVKARQDRYAHLGGQEWRTLGVFEGEPESQGNFRTAFSELAGNPGSIGCFLPLLVSFLVARSCLSSSSRMC